MSHPDVSFKFINNNQNRLHTSGNGNLRDIIYQIYGRDVTGQLLEVDVQGKLCHVTGFIGKPILSRGNRSWENYFINGRYIKSNIITKAIEDAYKTFVMIHKYPFTAFHIEVDPALIDVNVHPRKMELRFNQNEAVYQEIYDIIRAVLEHRPFLWKTRKRRTGKKKKRNLVRNLLSCSDWLLWVPDRRNRSSHHRHIQSRDILYQQVFQLNHRWQQAVAIRRHLIRIRVLTANHILHRQDNQEVHLCGKHRRHIIIKRR